MAVLCREFGISRQAGHKWLKRYKEEGFEGLNERSRRPQSTPLSTGEDMVVAIIEAKEKHSYFGPDKIRTAVPGRRCQALCTRPLAHALRAKPRFQSAFDAEHAPLCD